MKTTITITLTDADTAIVERARVQPAVPLADVQAWVSARVADAIAVARSQQGTEDGQAIAEKYAQADPQTRAAVEAALASVRVESGVLTGV